MSIERMVAVWEKSKHKGNALLLLLKIADNANDAGYCWPGIDYLAKFTKVSKPTIIRLTKILEESGELFVAHSRRYGNKYLVRVGMTDDQVKHTLTEYFSFLNLNEESLSNILLYNTCITSQVKPDVTSEVKQGLQEPSILNHQMESPNTFASSEASEPRCPNCHKPLQTSEQTPKIADVCSCQGEAVLGAAFGNDSPAKTAVQVESWADTLSARPWLGWSDGHFSPRQNASVEAQEHVAWILEDETTRKPTEKEWKLWSSECAAIYEAGRGDFEVIRTGIRAAWKRPPRFRPRKVTGFRDEVANAWAVLDQARAQQPALFETGRNIMARLPTA